MPCPSAAWLLQHRLSDVRQKDLPAFEAWLRRRVARWSQEPVFAQRLRIREIRRAQPGFLQAESRHRAATREDRESPTFARLHQLEVALHGVDLAVAGLRAAEKWEKLERFQERRSELSAELARLVARSPERVALVAARTRLEELRSECGFNEEEAVLRRLTRASGRGTGGRGRMFEEAALSYAETELRPRLGADRIVAGVTLGAVDTEFDLLLVKVEGGRAAVLAAVEAKRNVNDLAHGYQMRQRNLEWLAGRGEAQPTAYYRTGRFDRAYRHEDLVFDSESFRDVQLHMVTRSGWVWGVSSRALARLSYRVSTDAEFRWEREYLEPLRRWTLGLTHSLETPEVLRIPELNLAVIEHGDVQPDR